MKKILVILTFLVIMTSCFNKRDRDEVYGAQEILIGGGGKGIPFTEAGGR